MYDKGDRDDDKDDRNLLLYDKGDKDNDKYDGNLLLYDKGDKDDDKDDGNLLLYYKGDKDDGNLLLYDNGDKVNPLEPLRRGTKVGEKWQNGLQASKPRQIVRKVSAKGSKSFHEIKIKLLGELMNLELAQINLRT